MSKGVAKVRFDGVIHALEEVSPGPAVGRRQDMIQVMHDGRRTSELKPPRSDLMYNQIAIFGGKGRYETATLDACRFEREKGLP